jgi:hypothetical protein
MTRTRIRALAAHTAALLLLTVSITAAVHGAWLAAGLCWCFIPSLLYVGGHLNTAYHRERAVQQRLDRLRHQDGRPLTGYEHATWTALIARMDLPDDRSAA